MADPFESEEAMEFTEENIGDFLLHILTDGLYDRPDLIIREYIQNSHDAICEWSDKPIPGRIDIKVDWPNIHIFDNGPGMDRVELSNAMSNLGKSFKNISSSAGFMGIGKLAGLAMAARVEIHSSKYGVPEKNWVVFESDDMLTGIMERRLGGQHHSILDTLNKHTKVNRQPIPETAESHYTAVHLLDVHEDDREKIEDLKGFIRSLGLIAPVIQDPNFEFAPEIEEWLVSMIPSHYQPIDIFVNGEPVYRPYIEGLERPREIEVIDDDGQLLGYGWACLNTSSEPRKRQIPDETLQGISLMQRGIAVGDRTLPDKMGLYTGNTIYFRWYCGELYIVDPKIILSADRTRIRQSVDTLKFVEKTSREFRKLARRAEKFSKRDNAEVGVQDTAKKVADIEEQVKSQGVTSDRLPKILSDLSKARSSIESRKKHVEKEEIKQQAEEAEKKVEEIFDRLINAQQNADTEEDNTLPLSDILEANETNGDDLSDNDNANQDNVVMLDIPERLDFSPRETNIYQIIMQAIADVSGGRESNGFMKLTLAIEKALLDVFEMKEFDE